MTEEEARNKWCPMYKALKDVGDNRGEFLSTPKCIASDCMMWVWDGTVVSDVPTAEKVTNRGHCGLAR